MPLVRAFPMRGCARMTSGLPTSDSQQRYPVYESGITSTDTRLDGGFTPIVMIPAYEAYNFCNAAMKKPCNDSTSQISRTQTKLDPRYSRAADAKIGDFMTFPRSLPGRREAGPTA